VIIHTLRESTLLSNGIEITDLRKPFQRIVRKSDGVDTLRHIPSETLARPRKPLYYYVPITKTVAGALYNTEYKGLQSHWVYSTNTSISDVYRDKALQHMLEHLHIETETNQKIRAYLSRVLELLIASYTFDCIVTPITSLSTLTNFSLAIDNSCLIKLPKRDGKSQRYNSVRALLNGHKEGIPSHILDWEIYNEIDLSRNTTFDRKKIEGNRSILIIAGTNTQYAGFLARELKKIRGVREVLPVSLFYIGIWS
jgi:hypothetical protein